MFYMVNALCCVSLGWSSVLKSFQFCPQFSLCSSLALRVNRPFPPHIPTYTLQHFPFNQFPQPFHAQPPSPPSHHKSLRPKVSGVFVATDDLLLTEETLNEGNTPELLPPILFLNYETIGLGMRQKLLFDAWVMSPNLSLDTLMKLELEVD